MEASELFIKAFSQRHGTISATCACGVTHFASYCPGDFDPNELERLRQQAHTEPARCKEHDCSSLQVLHIDGKQFVDACECGKLKAYEDWVWSYRDQIARYLLLRLQHQQERVQSTMRVLQNYQDIKKPGCLVSDPT